jgi:hypothetical protein
MLVSALPFLFTSGLYGCILERAREIKGASSLTRRASLLVARVLLYPNVFLYFFLAVDLVTEWDVRVEELVRSEIGKAYPTFHL